MNLRGYQLDAVNRVRRLIGEGRKRILFCLPTGGGKTIVAAYIIASAILKASRVLFVAHRRELIKQCFAKLVRSGIHPSQIGIVMAGVPSKLVDELAPDPATLDDEGLWRLWARRRPAAPVQVASIDTLRTKTKPAANLVIVDEAHRALAASYVLLAQAYPDAVHVGLTATPVRSDNRGLGEAYDEIVVVASYMQLVALGFLVEPRVFTVPASALPDLSGVRVKKSGEYDLEQLAAAVDRAHLVGNIVDHWLRRGNGAPTFAYGVDRAHAQHLRDQFLEAGVPAGYVDAETPVEERDAALAKLGAGEMKVLCNVDVYTEGTDCPIVKTIILARPTKSLRVYLQQVGRGSRPHESGTPFVVLDHASCAVEHGLPQWDREYSLEPPTRSKHPKAPSVRICGACFAALPTATAICPECGFVFPAAEQRELEQRDGELVEVKPSTPEERRAYFDDLCARRGGRKPGWVYYRFLDRFGTKPPRDWKVPADDAPPPTDEELRAYWERCVEHVRANGQNPAAAKMRFHGKWKRWPPADWLAELEPASMSAPLDDLGPPPPARTPVRAELVEVAW